MSFIFARKFIDRALAESERAYEREQIMKGETTMNTDYITGRCCAPTFTVSEPEPVKADWVYEDPSGMDLDRSKLLKDVEKALGFRLFYWQKYFIEHGEMRCYGRTTAIILFDLLRKLNPEEPIDVRTSSPFYKHECKKIRDILVGAGIPCRELVLSDRDANTRLREKRIKELEAELAKLKAEEG